MRTLIVGFSTPTKPTLFSRLIEWTDKTPYDHVFLRWTWAGIERDIIYQASKFAVNFESNITFDAHAKTIEAYEVQISDECHKEIMQFCMDNSNKPYGIKEIFGFAWVKLCGWAGFKVNNPFPTHGASYVCSKLITEILQIAKIVDPRISPDNVDPLDLNRIIRAAGLKQLAVA